VKIKDPQSRANDSPRELPSRRESTPSIEDVANVAAPLEPSAIRGKSGDIADADRQLERDRVTISGSSDLEKTLEGVRQQLAATRTARVSEIADSVSKGQYTPDPRRIAERILDDAELSAKLRAMLTRT
jgi:flagellar biosynthesis anti-sigma factor FlgM